jgi:hypothetical protein
MQGRTALTAPPSPPRMPKRASQARFGLDQSMIEPRAIPVIRIDNMAEMLVMKNKVVNGHNF